MKTLSITAGLLLVLLAVHCCDASPHAVRAVRPDLCCFKFFEKRIPQPHVLSIIRTHSKCSIPAFVIKTPRGPYCVRQTAVWAMREFVNRETDTMYPKKQITHQASAVTLKPRAGTPQSRPEAAP
ncbi:C-C motif chemokine 4-like [Archocentrus centrarchus]|uniref:C-C motif chemokine 4-like n=1 Tax=Archocentrus centrarchus TaxID=63155 RepID=UPI0011EA08F7|nr:C-C motif chemokine 4-like [Archocentrus centrarchus]